MVDIGLVASDLVTGDGQGRVMLELTRRLLADGHDVTVYAHRVDADLRSLVRWHRISRPPGPDLVAAAWLALRASLALRRADHDLAVITGTAALPPRPYVYYAHFSHRGWRATWSPATTPPWRHRINSRVHSAIERPLARRAALVVACHDGLGEQLGVDPTRVAVVPNGVDPDVHRPATPDERAAARCALGLPPAAPVVGFVGEFHTPRKGLEALVAAVAAGAEHLVVAGSGDHRRITELAGRTGAGGRLHLVGVRPAADVFAASDLVAVPSSYEPFSMAALEAAAHGVPLVLSARAGAADHVPAVLIADPTDAGELRRALDRVLGDGDLRSAAAAAGPAAADRLDWKIVSEQAARAVAAVAERPLRILFVSHDPRLSGAERNLADLVAGLDRGVDAHAALPSGGPLADALATHGATVHRFVLDTRLAKVSRWSLQRRPWTAIGHGVAITSAVRSLDQVVAAVRPDVVMTVSLKAHLLLAPVAMRHRVRHVWWVQDILGPGAVRRFVAGVARRQASVVACLSDATAAPFRTGRRGDSRVIVLSPGVGTAAVEPRDRRAARTRLGADDDDVLVGIVGQLAHWKGQDVFVRAAALVAAARPDARFAIVGDCLFPENEAPYVARLEAMIDELGLRQRMALPGRIDPVDPVMASLDVFVHASRLPEPFGRVLVEAMAHGTPVVTTTIGAGPEVVPPGAGTFVPPDDPVALADAILATLALGPEARETAVEAARRYTPERAGRAVVAMCGALVR